MRRRLGKPSLAGLIVFGGLLVAAVVGLVVGGGTGTTIAVIAAVALALAVVGSLGGDGIAARDAIDGRGRWFGAHPLDREDRDERRP